MTIASKYDADLYIIAAGKGSRMGGNVPKALVPITDEPNLTTTLRQIGEKFQTVFIVTNEEVEDQWIRYILDVHSSDKELFANVVNLPITSGRGDGHAVMEALDHPYLDDIGCCDDIVIAWGDVFFEHAEIIDELMTVELPQRTRPVDRVGKTKMVRAIDQVYSGIVPAVMEDNPYVCLKTDDKKFIMSAQFSKHGEVNSVGYHDQSVFRFNRRTLQRTLYSLDVAYDKDGKYITPGGELSLLHSFHWMWNSRIPVLLYETKYPTKSFNTPAEVATIQTEIKEKWKIQHQS